MSFALRRERVWWEAAAEGLDTLLVSNPVNVSYLTGFSGESSYLILNRERALLVSDGRFAEQLAEESPDVEVYLRGTSQTLHQATAEQLRAARAGAIGFESSYWTVNDLHTMSEALPSAHWKAGNERVERLRAVKDAGEIEQIRAAVRMAERAFAMFRAFLRPDDTEKDGADALETYVRRAGGKATSFPSIVAVGARGALPHAPPTQKRIGEASRLLVDWGASGAFYKSDLTRVLWSHNNEARSETRTDEAKLRTLFGAVGEAQRRAIAVLRPGIAAKEVDAAARGYLGEVGLGPQFTHGLGHGIGMQIHEAPFLRPNADTVLQAGMVVTVEPGVYLPGWGGVRIEDDVLVTPDGAEVLTRCPRDFEACRLDF